MTPDLRTRLLAHSNELVSVNDRSAAVEWCATADGLMVEAASALAAAPEALREFADEADSTIRMVIRTFGDRNNPPKLLDAFATVTMCKKLTEQYDALAASQTSGAAE